MAIVQLNYSGWHNREVDVHSNAHDSRRTQRSWKLVYFEKREILYNNSDTDSLETLTDIEITVRNQLLEHVSPKIALF